MMNIKVFVVANRIIMSLFFDVFSDSVLSEQCAVSCEQWIMGPVELGVVHLIVPVVCFTGRTCKAQRKVR